MKKNLFGVISAGIAVALQYLPYVHTAVQQVEVAVAGAPGSDKKAIALSAVLTAAHAGETVPVPQVQMIGGLIDTVVGMLNVLGVFGKATPPVSVAVAPAPTPAS